jgi:hypothetical protein
MAASGDNRLYESVVRLRKVGPRVRRVGEAPMACGATRVRRMMHTVLNRMRHHFDTMRIVS